MNITDKIRLEVKKGERADIVPPVNFLNGLKTRADIDAKRAVHDPTEIMDNVERDIRHPFFIHYSRW